MFIISQKITKVYCSSFSNFFRKKEMAYTSGLLGAFYEPMRANDNHHEIERVNKENVDEGELSKQVHLLPVWSAYILLLRFANEL